MSDTAKPEAQPSPWPDPVDDGQLLNDLVAVIQGHVVLTDHQALTVALWCIQTWCHQRFHRAAILMINAPEAACGKSILLDLTGKLVRRPIELSGTTEATMFRLIEVRSPTLLIDEVDTFIEANSGFAGVLNAGFERDGTIWRTDKVGEKFEPVAFRVFGMKALAGIDIRRKLQPATVTRCIEIGMRRKLPHETVARLRHADPALFANLRARMKRFVDDHGEQLACGFTDMPAGLSDRQEDAWEPLLSIANAAGPEALVKAKAAALHLNAQAPEPESVGNRLLGDVRTVLTGSTDPYISTVDLLDRLTESSEMGWNAWNRGQPMTPRQLSNFLRAYGLASRTVRLPSGKTPKGWVVAEFDEVFRRFLPPPESVPSADDGLPDNAADAVDAGDAADDGASPY